MLDAPDAAPNSAGRLYARIWRWHFFAALLVIPFVMWQSLSGTIHLWRNEIADGAYSSLRRVEPRAARANFQTQLETVLAHHPDGKLGRVDVADDPSRATAFFFTAPNGLQYPAFVDPYTAEYLGSVSPGGWLPGVALSMHGGWPLGTIGSYLLELGASWAVVMILTGLYLWWPRHARGLAGVLYPRIRNGSRVFWRDVHSTAGVYLALVVLALLLTALPWTAFWGEQLLGSVQHATGQVSPTAAFFEKSSSAELPVRSTEHHHGGAEFVSADSVALDAIVTQARRHAPTGTLEIKLAAGHAPVNVRNQLDRSKHEVYLQLDRHSGAVLSRTTWQETPAVAKLIAYGVDLHEGTYFGVANRIFNTFVALGLVWLAVSGFIGWYNRRPNGGMAAPPRREVLYPKAVLAAGFLICLALPLLALSAGSIAILDRVLGRALTRAQK